MSHLSRRERVAIEALAHRLDETPGMRSLVVEDYHRASGKAHALQRRLGAIGPGPAMCRETHLMSGGSEHLQPPGTVDETGFCDGVV